MGHGSLKAGSVFFRIGSELTVHGVIRESHIRIARAYLTAYFCASIFLCQLDLERRRNGEALRTACPEQRSAAALHLLPFQGVFQNCYTVSGSPYCFASRLRLSPLQRNRCRRLADVGELEFELQPAGLLQEGANQTLVAPWLVTNFGFAKDWEAVLEGQLQTPLSFAGPPSLTDASLTLKHVLREGSLQDKKGPSIATEFGLLLPGIGADAGVGGTWDTIISERWDWGTIHLNLQPSLTRDHRAELFLSTILEGPSKWKVRPVAEIYFDEQFDQETTVSALVGLIWQVRESVAVDFAVRAASVNGRPVEEIRAGVTFGIPVWRTK